jgi:hypothetical protein
MKKISFIISCLLCVVATTASSEQLTNLAPSVLKKLNGLTIEPEYRCSVYDRKNDYRYSQSVESKVIRSMGGVIYAPYTGRIFTSKRDTDIEHIVATSEAHDSGLCAADINTRKAFASDILNLTLAAPEVNRCGAYGKCAYDAAEWLPNKNKCWFASRVVNVKQKYSLSVDSAEAEALEAILTKCTSTQLIFYKNSEQTVQKRHKQSKTTSSINALELWDDNNNGRITCKEARKHGIAPIPKGHPAYRFMRDADKDGIVCEK